MPIPTTRVVGGELPPGLQMTGRGDVEGIPTEPGVYSFAVEVSDGCTRRVEQRQIRVMPSPILLAEAETLEFQCVHGAPPFSGGIVRVSGSAPGRAYTVDVLNGPWLTATMRDGALPNDGSAFEGDNLTLRVDPGKLTAGTYTARLRLSTWQGANTPELLFKLRVDSPQTVLAPLAAAPAPIVFAPPVIIEAPSPRVIVAPTVAHMPPPRFPRYIPKPKPKPKPAPVGYRGAGRSRVLPFPKIVLPPKAVPKEEKPAPKAGEKAGEKAAAKPPEKAAEKPKEKAAEKPAAPKPESKQAAKPPAKEASKETPKAAPKKEAAPERTKPSAMPPAGEKH